MVTLTGRSNRSKSSAGRMMALCNMRGVSIVFVVAFHSVIAYVAFLPNSPYTFDRSPYLWRAFPIIDQMRWFGFDLFCAWINIYLMTFFFFLSGLFVWSSLKSKGRHRFLIDRGIRLALPFALAVGLLMPIANYPTYLQSSSLDGFGDYWRHWLALPFWPCGPMWFIGLLLAFDVLVVIVDAVAPKWGAFLIRLSSTAARHPVRYMIGLTLASATAYLIMALAFTPTEWMSFGPLSFQPSRLLHYCVYFFAGIGIGAYGIDRGLFAPDGWLLRHCGSMLAGAMLLFVLWMLATAATLPDPNAASPAAQTIAAIAFVMACASNCLAMLALGFKYANRPLPMLDGLSEDAYGIYLVHYPFVIWLQFFLLGFALPAIVKGAIVLGVALLLSRLAVVGIRYGARAAPAFPSVANWGTPQKAPLHADRPPP